MSDRTCLLITTFNRSIPQLRNSLERLTRLTLPDEVLIVDDGSSDGCEQVVKIFEGRLPIRYIYNHNIEWSICSMARNIGIKNTDCEIIITSEPEILYITDVIQQMKQKHLEVSNKVISAGTIYHMGPEAVLHEDMMIAPGVRLLHEAVNDSGHGTYPNNPRGYAKIQGWVAPFSALYRREWLMAINGWCENYISWGFDDTDLLTRLTMNGIGQDISRDIECIHQWHEKLPPHIQYNAAQQNERMFLDKKLQPGSENVIANRNKEWGVIKQR